MWKKFMDRIKKAIILLSIPAVINIAMSVSCYFIRSEQEFVGYLSGTILSLIFSLTWIWMIRKFSLTNILVIIAISMGILPVKFIVFAAFAFGGLYLFHMDKLFFAYSFLFGTFVGLLIEVWFITSVNRSYRSKT